MALQITTTKTDDAWILAADGEIDLYTSPNLRKAVMDAIASKKAVAIDLSKVGYMDSSGVATLVEGLKTCGAKKQGFILVSPSDAVLKVLQLARLDSLFDIRESYA